ncbi:Down syndrome cell adhesion molecule-like protein Dscam2 [Schistocerca americana]|uniref:Down syndrome cell adhesion molecule-like protein Dscam2 n=1 Tax=Schistocerca americana TaxID=7009 RepID=UPI001F4FA107|nr:Down syndrome cell adhesion molecule-like protein Dscam2 [Schistocerca americana]
MVPQQQTVDVRRTAQLNCSTEGHPQLAISWLKDGQPLHTYGMIKLVTPQTLRIEQVERSDLRMYQCVVSNNEETAQGTAEVSLGAPWCAPATPGRRQCEASGSPLPSVSWLLDGHPLTSEGHVQVSVEAGSAAVSGRVRLAAAAAEDAGVYECVASSAGGVARHAAPLQVRGPPRVRPMAAFHCRVTGYPVSEIRWQKAGKPLPEQHRQQVFPNGTLIVKDIQKVIDEGGYVCIATDPDGSTARSKLNVQVTEAPEIDPIIVKPDLQEGMRMNLMCVVSKGDFPIAIQWLKDGVAINYEQGVSENSFDEYSSTLSFNSLMMKHTGNYTCQASNAAASRNYTVEVVVNDRLNDVTLEQKSLQEKLEKLEDRADVASLKNDTTLAEKLVHECKLCDDYLDEKFETMTQSILDKTKEQVKGETDNIQQEVRKLKENVIPSLSVIPKPITGNQNTNENLNNARPSTQPKLRLPMNDTNPNEPFSMLPQDQNYYQTSPHTMHSLTQNAGPLMPSGVADETLVRHGYFQTFSCDEKDKVHPIVFIRSFDGKTNQPKNKKFQYSPSKVKDALKAIDEGMKVATASKLYKVPRTTLRNKISGVSPKESTGHCGPHSVLGEQIEKKIGRLGFGLF